MKKSIKALYVIIFFLITVSSFSIVYSANSAGGGESIKGWATDFIDAGGEGASGDLNGPINQIAGVLTGIGVFGVVIVGSVLGIQYMIGSASDQAKIKESLIPYAIGSIVVMGAVGIFNAVIGALDNAGI